MSAMPVSQQVALARPRSIGPPTHISNVTRQIVPPFLQKLYEMVNDPKNEELIRWSEAGDSFYVLDHERFANEVLGRWFKHRNFSSFVRQLNMYGFHKIPHLQQGVLKSDTDKEFWNFAHANFRKGQPDMLCLIQRKKQMAQQDEGIPVAMEGVRVEDGHSSAPASTPSGSAAASPGGALALNSGQVLDIQSIVNGIAAIRRHQTTISAELNELRKSNQMLWQEAMTARTRHQKQQDTINKIVKFLAGMFGNHADSSAEHARVVSVSDDQDGVVSMGMGMNIDRDANAGNFMRRQRLMIEAARNEGGDTDMDDEPLVETPRSAPSPAPSVTDSITITDQSGQYGGNLPNGHDSNHRNTNTQNVSSGRISPATSSTSTPTTESTDLFSSSLSAATSSAPTSIPPHSSPETKTTTPTPSTPTPSQTSHTQQHLELSPRPISRPPSAFRDAQPTPALDWDPTMQSVFNTLSAQQIQQLLTSIAAVQPFDPNFPAQDASGSQMMHYQPSPFDFAAASPSPGFHSFPSFDASAGSSTSTTALHTDPIPPSDPMLNLPTEGLISFDTDAQGKAERHWRAAEDIDKDVSALDNGINQLISMFGLQPEEGSVMDGGFGAGEEPVISSVPVRSDNGVGVGVGGDDVNMNGMAEQLHTTEGNEFDLDSFLNTLPGTDEQETESTFLDEVPPMPKTTSGVGTKGKKRKSEVTEEIRAIQKDNNASKAAVAVSVGGAGVDTNGKAASAGVGEKRRKVQEGE